MISPARGRVYYHFGIRSFTAEDFKIILQRTREASGPDALLALFLDNCKIHRAHVVQDFAASPEINIELVWNLPYRPDLAGIEKLWADAKRRYIKELDRLKAHDIDFDHRALVEQEMDGIEDE